MTMKGGRQLPSQHEKDREAMASQAAVQLEEAKREHARLLAAFDWLLQQENGRLVWGWLFERCGYAKPVLLRAAGGDVAPISTECAAAQREVYRDLRKMISAPALLVAAEYEAEFGEPLVVKSKEGKGEK